MLQNIQIELFYHLFFLYFICEQWKMCMKLMTIDKKTCRRIAVCCGESMDGFINGKQM